MFYNNIVPYFFSKKVVEKKISTETVDKYIKKCLKHQEMR
jgi:hypothetical protein